MTKPKRVKETYKVGDKAYIHLMGDAAGLTEGKVVHVFKDVEELYIIRIETYIEPIYEVRSWRTISQNKKGPVGIWRKVKS